MAPVSNKEFLDIQANMECRFTLKLVRHVITTYRYIQYFTKKQLLPVKAGANQSNISSNITFLPCWMKCWNGLRNYKIYKVSKKKKKIMLDDVG